MIFHSFVVPFLNRIIIVLRRILISMVFLLSVLLLGAFSIPFFISWTDFQEKIERQASLFIGKKIVVRGIEVSILPFPAIVFRDIGIDQRDNGSFESRIKKISINVHFFPLLFGEIRVCDMHIDRPYVTFYLPKNKGMFNVSKESNKVNSSHENSIMAMIHNIVLEKSHIDEGRIQIIDQESDKSYFISGLNLEISANILDISSPLSINSIKGFIGVEGRGKYEDNKSSFKIMATLPAQNNSFPLKVQIASLDYSIVFDFNGNFFWDQKNPIYTGVFSAYGHISKLLPLKIPIEWSKVSGDFDFSDWHMRIEHYKLQSGSLRSLKDKDQSSEQKRDK
ncbi:hypothetical protein CKC_03780 [Candidatus Liberibacter solanacearum CLso-ZC1]|uniref:AsmA domain-containing protein n=2 Tax=Candidatus Liberibacter solanacearum TaxID=556287 RepID=E4UBK0_LIBSC|nr:hypothetical protein CKC_03780 [Candidatus Liberibacter solanacearum CLso-ZC1]